jgi:hypothetical protein
MVIDYSDSCVTITACRGLLKRILQKEKQTVKGKRVEGNK